MLFKDYSYSPMPAKPDERLNCTITNSVGHKTTVQYQINKQHRDRNPNKAQWEILCEEEVAVFAGSVYEGIVEDEKYMWGLYIPMNKPSVLGVTKNGDESKIARFDNGRHNGFWHGYPADYIKSQEYPQDEVLDLWRNKKVIDKADINKIIKGVW